jgi:hypothetical protein
VDEWHGRILSKWLRTTPRSFAGLHENLAPSFRTENSGKNSGLQKPGVKIRLFVLRVRG